MAERKLARVADEHAETCDHKGDNAGQHQEAQGVLIPDEDGDDSDEGDADQGADEMASLHRADPLMMPFGMAHSTTSRMRSAITSLYMEGKIPAAMLSERPTASPPTTAP